MSNSQSAIRWDIALERSHSVWNRIHNWLEVSLRQVEKANLAVTTTFDQPLEFIESPSLKVARLPLWPTKSHIDGLVQAWKLDAGNIFVGKEAWKNAEINKEVPQVFGYTITNNQELAGVITDKKALDAARKEVEVSGTFPTIYVLNHEARLAHAAYLGGRLPTQEEQKSFWDKLPGANILEKVTGASIPFLGCFDVVDREFYDVGRWEYLMSSFKYDGGFFKSLEVFRGIRGAVEGWYAPEYGFSFLVVFE